MHGFDTISVRSEAQEKNVEVSWPGAQEFYAHDGTGAWTKTTAKTTGPFRFRFKRLPHGVAYLTMEFELPRLVRGGASNIVVPHAAQVEALKHAHAVWISAGGDYDPVVWRLDAACDVPWPKTCWPGLKAEASKLRAPRTEGTTRAETQSWDQRNKRIKMYPKEDSYVRLEYHLGKSKSIAEALPDKALEGLTLLDLPSLGKEISRLLLLKAADQIGIWALRKSTREELLEALLSDEKLGGGGVLRLFGLACAIDMVGEETLFASAPASMRRTLYRTAAELRDRGARLSGGPMVEYAEELHRALTKLDAPPKGEKIEWRGEVHQLRRALAAEKERRQAA